MRLGILATLAALLTAPALAQPYDGPGPAVRHDVHQARRAEHVARERAAVGDYAGAARAHRFAQHKRFEAHQLRREGY